MHEKSPVPFSKRTLSLGSGDRQITFAVDDLCRHTIIFGSSGSGKTTRAFNPLLRDMLGKLGAGAFIVAAKPEAVLEAVEIANRTGREYLVVQPGSPIGLDLLTGNPDVDAMYFRDTFGRVGDETKTWVDAAVARMKNSLRLLAAAGPQYYTFDALTSYVFDDEFSAHIRIFATERMRGWAKDSDETWTVHEAISYEEKRWLTYSPETRRAVQFAVGALLEPLRDIQIIKTFSRKQNLVSMDAVFEGKVIILHVPRTQFERAAQSIYTLAKRRFFTALEYRRSNPKLNQDRPVVFGIDEYQLCISESDVQSLGIIRSAGCMVLGTTQGVSSLYSVLPQHVVDAALQNFTQKIFFKTDDHDTLAVLDCAVAKTTKDFDSTTLFKMKRDEGLCHVTAGDETIDVVLPMLPLYVTPNYMSSAAPAAAGLRL